MAFKNNKLIFTHEMIQNIDAEDIPEAFYKYYNGLPEERQKEIASVRPELIAKIKGESKQEISTSDELSGGESSTSQETELKVEIDEGNEEEDENAILLNRWEEITTKAWKEQCVEVPVFVCKVIPSGMNQCRVHRVPLQNKQVYIKKKKRGTYNITGYWCPECMDFFIYQNKINGLIEALDERKIDTLVQPLEETINEWKKTAQPIEIGEDEAIYVPDTWHAEDMRCPIHEEERLTVDFFKKTYKDRHVEFEACVCSKCKKIIMRNSAAQKLDELCGEIGVGQIEFKKIRKVKEKVSRKVFRYTPDFFIQNGTKDNLENDYDEDLLFEPLTEEDNVVIGYDKNCIEDDHESEETVALVRVREKKGGIKNYLVVMGYCDICEQYYIEKEDYELLKETGRPIINVIDETNTYDSITSGASFAAEAEHLESVKGVLNKAIEKIKSSGDYVGLYDGVKGGYDVGLNFKKNMSAPLRALVTRYEDYKMAPYRYRTDIVHDNQNETRYLGQNEIIIDGVSHVFNINSDLGRKLSSYRTLEVVINKKKWKVKRRRDFEISNGHLFGFTEQSDEDLIFSSGITDPFLIKVLKARKKHHSPTDIYGPIQENQNKILDIPLNQNIIVQGCAGSGKTMVLLHRLAVQKYNHPEIGNSDVVILTPNNNFNSHITGLTTSMQMGNIEHLSVEEYYRKLLEEYDRSFKISTKIRDEMEIDQNYVDVIYSDVFKTYLDEGYDIELSQIREYYAQILAVEDAYAIEKPILNNNTDNQLLTSLQTESLRALDGVNKIEEKYDNDKKQYQDLVTQHQRLSEQARQQNLYINKVISDIIKKLSDEMMDEKETIRLVIAEKEKAILEYTQRADELEKQRLDFNASREAEYKYHYKRAEELACEQAKLNEQRTVVAGVVTTLFCEEAVSILEGFTKIKEDNSEKHQELQTIMEEGRKKLEKERDNLQKILEDKTNNVDELQENIHKLETESYSLANESIDRAKAVIDMAIMQIDREIEIDNSEREKLEKEYRENEGRRKEIRELTLEIIDERKTKEKKIQEIEEQRDRISEAEKELKKIVEEKTQETINKLNSVTSKLINAVDENQSSIKKLEDEHSRVRRSVFVLRKTEKIDGIQKQIDEKVEYQSKMLKNLDFIKEEIEKSKHIETVDELLVLLAEINTIVPEDSGFNKRMLKKQRDINDEQNKISHAEQILHDCEERIKELEWKVVELEEKTVNSVVLSIQMKEIASKIELQEERESELIAFVNKDLEGTNLEGFIAFYENVPGYDPQITDTKNQLIESSKSLREVEMERATVQNEMIEIQNKIQKISADIQRGGLPEELARLKANEEKGKRIEFWQLRISTFIETQKDMPDKEEIQELSDLLNMDIPALYEFLNQVQENTQKIQRLEDEIAKKEEEKLFEISQMNKAEERIIAGKSVDEKTVEEAIAKETKEKDEALNTDKNLDRYLTMDFSVMRSSEVLRTLEEIPLPDGVIRPFKNEIVDQCTKLARITVKRDEILSRYEKLASQIERFEQNDGFENDRKLLKELNQKVGKITPRTLYNDAYKYAGKKVVENHYFQIKPSVLSKSKGIHRFDLYAMLLFAQRYFQHKIGENKYICIDEGQDLAINEYLLLSSVNNPKPVFNIYGDTNQLLKKGRGVSDWKMLEEIVTGTEMCYLNENYRNTNQIINYTNQALKMNVSLLGVDGHKVKDIDRSRLESTLSKLRLSDERIALVLPRAVDKETYLDVAQLPKTIKKCIGNDIGNGKIALVYVDEIKGIEFDRVFVVPNGMSKNEQYIAFTRALSDLTIVVDDSIPEYREDIDSDTKKPSNAETSISASGSIRVGKVVKKKKRNES